MLLHPDLFLCLQKLLPVTLPDQSPRRPGHDTPAREPYPGRPGSEVLANMRANQNIWPGGSWGASPPASRSVPAYLKRHKSGQLLALDGEAMHKSVSPALEPTGPGQLPRQELIGRAAPPPPPHLPMAMHSCRIWPKGRRRLNHSCPSKERESYQEVGPREKERARKGAGRQQPFPGSSARQKRHPPFTTSHAASSGPTLRGSARQGSLTLVAVGEVSSA